MKINHGSMAQRIHIIRYAMHGRMREISDRNEVKFGFLRFVPLNDNTIDDYVLHIAECACEVALSSMRVEGDVLTFTTGGRRI